MIPAMAQRLPSEAIGGNGPQDRPYTREEKLDFKLRLRHQGFAHKLRTRCIICSRMTNKKARGYCDACRKRLQPSELEQEAIAERARKGRSCGTCESVFGACLHTRAALKMEMAGDCFFHVESDPECRECRSELRRKDAP